MALDNVNGMLYKDGEPYYLISGEVHYFRLNPEDWEVHLTLLKESGANTVSTYIPWDWHEYEDGEFDFTGHTHSGRNLLGFIKLCQEIGLDMIVKPGPYILAEYESHGLPGWLLQKLDRSSFAMDEEGEIISPDVVSYMSEGFLRYAFRWYDAIMPIVWENQCTQSGPIIMMQVCNEVGIFQWLSGRVDYNPAVISLYKEFIVDKYDTINDLNHIYGTEYTAFSEVKPPTGVISDRQHYAAYYDFQLFYRHYFALYFDTLIKKIRSFGIDIQLTHNIPGWIYGNASEMPMLMSTYDEVMKRGDVLFGLDHIPEFFSFRNAHSDLACNKIISSIQEGPVWAAEFQAGTREHHVRNYPNDMRAFYYASLAHGLKGFNYYMFSQGENPEGKGYYGKTFYYQTALDSYGNKLPLYDVIDEINQFIQREMSSLVYSQTEACIGVGMYKPYFYTELVSSQMLKEKKLDVEKLGLTLDPRYMREEIWFNGLLRGLQTLNYIYNVCDIIDMDLVELMAYKQLWVVSTEYMDRYTQELLAGYVERGGHLIIYPTIPTLDEYLSPCSALADAFGIAVSNAKGPLKVEVFGIRDIYTYTSNKQVYGASGAEAISLLPDNRPCGIEKHYGKGNVTALGFAWGYASDEHLQFFEKIIAKDNIGKDADVSDPEIQFVVRKSRGCSYLFLMNYHNKAKQFTVDGQVIQLDSFSCLVIKRMDNN